MFYHIYHRKQFESSNSSIQLSGFSHLALMPVTKEQFIACALPQWPQVLMSHYSFFLQSKLNLKSPLDPGAKAALFIA